MYILLNCENIITTEKYKLYKLNLNQRKIQLELAVFICYLACFLESTMPCPKPKQTKYSAAKSHTQTKHNNKKTTNPHFSIAKTLTSLLYS